MLDSRRVDALTLTSDNGKSLLPLAAGVHGLARDPAADWTLMDPGQGIVQLRVDRRGVWLTVHEQSRGVHVNGRPVRRVAMLRPGDCLHLDGSELTLLGREPTDDVSKALAHHPSERGEDARVLLRGMGGRHHGRSFPLLEPCLVGSHRDAGIGIDSPGFPSRFARLEQCEDKVLLRDLDSPDGMLVNGHRVRDALLRAGDQVVFDARNRFVVEAPSTAVALAALNLPAATESERRASSPPPARLGRLPLLIIAALLLAAALSALLLWGGPK